MQLKCNKVTAFVFPGINDSFPQPPEVTDMEFLWKETLCQRKQKRWLQKVTEAKNKNGLPAEAAPAAEEENKLHPVSSI